ncbi:MAG: hypothetical protein CK427_10385 [Leptospira sp.]|nr:MAG: hypothetical protein CK427_10385 [Leptospira sp.]
MIIQSFHKIKSFLLIHPENNLKLQGIRSVSWSIIGKGTSYGLRLVSNILLTYMLSPSSFGLMATCLVIITMIQLFSDIGIKTAIIQSKDADKEEFLNTAWSISLLRGLFLFIFCFLISYPLSVFYDQEILLFMIWIISFSIPLGALENPGIYLNIKKLRTDLQVIYEFGSEILSIFFTVSLAFLLQNVWALVIGSLFTPIFKIYFSYKLNSFRPKFQIFDKYSKDLLRFGKFIMINTLVTWAALNLDTLFIGKWNGMNELGNYNIGKNLAISLEMFLVGIIGQSFFPIISNVQSDLTRVQKIYRRSSTLALTFAIPIIFNMIYFSEEIIHILYREEFYPAIIPMFWVSCRGIFRIISMFQGSTLIGIGRAELETYSMSFALLVFFLLFYGFYFKIIDVELFSFLEILNIGKISSLYIQSTLVFLVGFVAALAEMLLLIAVIKCSYRSILTPWFQSFLLFILMGFSSKMIHPILKEFNFSDYSIIFVISAICLCLSIGFYFLLEGKKPWKDMGGGNL